jgi:CTP synthase (UTP-ammonia lyase)
MNHTINIGVIGDYNANLVSHPATNSAIVHTARYLDVKENIEWVSTPSLTTDIGLKQLEQFDGLWISAGSPYKSLDGALNGIRFAREWNRPLFGT